MKSSTWSAIRLLLLRGPGEIEETQMAIVARQWSVLVNLSPTQAAEAWPALQTIWQTRHVDSFDLGRIGHGWPAGARAEQVSIPGSDWNVTCLGDERRPGRRSLLLHSNQMTLGVTPVGEQFEPPPGRPRTLLLDASWTHISRFPDLGEMRDAFIQAFDTSPALVHYITNLPWDADFFHRVSVDSGYSERARIATVTGMGQPMMWQLREIIPTIRPTDMVLLGLVPGRDDRGAFQRLRSEFAERTPLVRAFPSAPISSGPGPSREEALETVGLWLPTRVLISGGPVSEQVLLARYLEENTGGSPVSVGVAGTEYRLPSLQLARQLEPGRRRTTAQGERLRTSRAGLVVVTYGRDQTIQLRGAGLADDTRAMLPKIRITPRGKTAEQIVREIEGAFSSRGMPVPAVRFLA